MSTRTAKRLSGLFEVEYKTADPTPLALLLKARQSAINNAERGVAFQAEDVRRWRQRWDGPQEIDSDWELFDELGLGPELLTLHLHMIGVRVVRTRPTLYPEYGIALIEVTGDWVDGDGETHIFEGAQKVNPREASE